MKRAILSAVLLAAALIFQLTVVNRLPLPGAGTPDLVLLLVVTLGLCGGPSAGAVTGFCAGLGLDLAPPGSYLIGEYALAFCLVGYLCGRLRSVVDRSALLTVGLAMLAAAAGEALVALLGLMLSDPQVTWPAVRQVLPAATLYDIVLVPFVLYAVVRVVRWADSLGRYRAASDQPADGAALLARAQAGGSLPRGSLPGGAGLGALGIGGTVLGGAGLLGGAGWLAGPQGARSPRGGGRKSTARAPRLREAAARPGDGWVGGGPRPGMLASQRPAPARPLRPGRPPKLRPGSGSPGSAVARPPRTLPPSPANLRIGAGRRKDGSIGRGPGSVAGAGPAGAALRARGKSGPPGSAFRTRRPDAGRPGGLTRAGVAPAGGKFRPDPRMRGGSSSAGAIQRAALPTRRAALSSRRVPLRLGSARRHDGVLGGSVLGGSAAGGRWGGGTIGLGARRGLARPVSLRLGSSRRGDGTVAGLASRRRFTVGSRQAAPKFRSGSLVGGRSVFGRRSVLGGRKRSTFGSGRRSLLSGLTRGRAGSRSTVWRIGSRRTGGLR
ncbi:MAG TPA: rod shape-determining protein MreD [Streptosporangiaceae bacterium]